MNSMYLDGSYLDLNPTWHIQDQGWKAKQVIKLITRNAMSINTVCEIGCGTGELLRLLANTMGGHIQFFGYEVSPQAFELCQEREKLRSVGESITFRLEDITETSKATHFDLLMAIDVIEHVEDYIGFIKAIKKRATYKVFHVPLELSVNTILRSSPIREARKRVGHIHYFTKETLLDTLVDAQYDIIDHFFTYRSLHLQNRSFGTALLKLPRRILFKMAEDIAIRILGGASLMVLAK